jgi:hypothetical protein
MAKTQLTALAALQRVLEQPERILLVVAKSMSEEAINLVKDGFRAETDPYGRKWAPKKRNDGRKVLSGRTSRLKGGWHLKVVSTSEIVVAPSVDYAAPHQNPQMGSNGQLKRPRRMMVPDALIGMPQKWTDKLDASATEAFGAILGGDGRRAAGLRKRLALDAFVGFKVG